MVTRNNLAHIAKSFADETKLLAILQDADADAAAKLPLAYSLLSVTNGLLRSLIRDLQDAPYTLLDEYARKITDWRN